MIVCKNPPGGGGMVSTIGPWSIRCNATLLWVFPSASFLCIIHIDVTFCSENVTLIFFLRFLKCYFKKLFNLICDVIAINQTFSTFIYTS